MACRHFSSFSSKRKAAWTTSLALRKRPEATWPAINASISGVSDTLRVLTLMDVHQGKASPTFVNHY
jgi:hypothetical protein